ncbi:hypothetical protein [Pelagibacterium luteolum]|uniref:Uncharacterized protein n=1 Tax=Pelagibacterium luteolum TaxID=440168 RepID=A0A1G7ZHB9_9HYPH|nr:hypothetical protein [Pelagibacterium luteolum]SDH07967.1 hypothetical protein SAMN04487974_12012 [Pelagibacterium luteolum]
MNTLTFKPHPHPMMPLPSYLARAGAWQFLIVEDRGLFTASYRLRNPKSAVSASSTIMGPFDSFEGAQDAANAKWQEIRGLA